MKRISAALALTAALSLGVTAYAQTTTAPAAPAAPMQFSDIPAGHYAQEAVDRIVQAGLILGFPDGTFRGNENLTRYQAALIFARLLDLISQGRIGTEAAPATAEGGQNLDAETLEAVQAAVQELAADLAQLGVRIADLEDGAGGVTSDDLARVESLAQEARDLAEAVAAAQNAGMGMDDLTGR
ncbi:MAG TPA: S-layer homology domain-containing protein, partial [Deinococcales bacterium]|nr:S-layer homology domain-containing protein [Deinococcales bacterium]